MEAVAERHESEIDKWRARLSEESRKHGEEKASMRKKANEAKKAEKTRDFEKKNQYLKYGKNSLNTLAPRILSP